MGSTLPRRDHNDPKKLLFCFCKEIVSNLEQKSIKTVRETEFTNVSFSNGVNLELFHSVFDETSEILT